MSIIKEKYETEVKQQLMTDLEYKSIMQVPKIEKIIINMGLGAVASNTKLINDAVEELTIIAGQKAMVTKAKYSIAGFKLREEQPIGAKVTLRGKQMYNFLDKLIMISLPRVRDFQGLKRNSFDGQGNYTFGVTEQLIFPEIDYDKVSKLKGMDITIVTTAQTDEEGLALLEGLGFPIVKKGA